VPDRREGRVTNQIALALALLIVAAIGWDVFLNDAFWTEIWARRFLGIIDAASFWN
jgi:hypothetical protein